MRGNSNLSRCASQVSHILGQILHKSSTNYLGVGDICPFSEGGSILGQWNLSRLTAQNWRRVSLTPILRPVVRHFVFGYGKSSDKTRAASGEPMDLLSPLPKILREFASGWRWRKLHMYWLPIGFHRRCLDVSSASIIPFLVEGIMF